MRTLVFLIFFSLLAPAQITQRSVEDWEDLLMAGPSAAESLRVFGLAAERAEAKEVGARAFLERRLRPGAFSSQTWLCLQSIRESRAFELPRLVRELDRSLSQHDERMRLWRSFLASRTWRSEAISELLESIDRHRHDPRGNELFPLLESVVVVADESSTRAIKSLLLSLYEDPGSGALGERSFALGMTLATTHSRDFEIAALLDIDPRFALGAAQSLMAADLDGVDVLIAAALFDEPGRFHRAGLDQLLSAQEAGPLRLRVLERIETADAELMRSLAPLFIEMEAREVDLFCNQALREGGRNARRIAFGRIRREWFTVPAELLRTIVAEEELSDPATMIGALDALAGIEGKRSKSWKALFAYVRTKDEAEFHAHVQALLAASPRSPELREIVSGELASRGLDWDRLALLLALAAELDSEDATAWAERSLEHPRWQVRLAAIEALTRVGDRRALIPLATATAEPRLRLARAAARGLRRLTGQDFGSQPEAWFRYIAGLPSGWRALRHPEAASPIESADPRYATSFYGLDLGSNHVIFVCDSSGSMEGLKIEKLKLELSQAISSIDRDGAFNILFFADRLRGLFRNLESRNARNLRRAEDFSARIRADGGTNLWTGLETAFKDEEADTLVVLTDGQPTVGSFTLGSDILREVRARNRKLRLRIHTLELGPPTGADFMRRLAAENEGQHRQVP